MMQKIGHIVFILALIFFSKGAYAQSSSSPAPYCNGGYTSGNCNQGGPSNTPGNFVNDFINSFNTTGAGVNITNNNSGCNNGPNNYANYCSHYLSVSPGQTITCNIQSGIIYSQGFAIFIDWNQDNVFNLPSEQVAATSNVPAASTWTTLTFVIPPSQPNGVYRMRVRCAFATPGVNITPCGQFGYGETEDYTIFVGPIPPSAAVPSGTALVNSPICVGQALNFSLTTGYTSALSFTWTGPASFSSTLQNPSIFGAAANASGIYTVVVSNSLCPITTTVSAVVVPYPSFTVVPGNSTICQGGSLNGTASLTTNPNLYTFHWATTAPGLIFNPGLQSTLIQPGLLPVSVPLASYVYSITVTPTLNAACAVTQTMGITINNPLTPTLTMPNPLCNISAPLQLTATPGGGTWVAVPAIAITAGGLFNPAVANIPKTVVLYSVSAGTCIVSNKDTVYISRYHTAALSTSISTRCVQDPLFNLMNIVQDTVGGHWLWTATSQPITNNLFSAASLPTGPISLTYTIFSTPNPTVCPASTVLIVPIFNPPIPVINSYTPVCDNSPTLALSATPPNGVWSGNSGVTATGIRTSSLCAIGTNTVTYTAGLGTCVATSSKTFHVSQYNPATLTGTIPNLCVTSNPINLMSIVQNTNGAWGGIGIYTTTPNVFNPAYLSSIYTLTYNTRSTPILSLCPASQTIAVSVLAPVTPTITQLAPHCSKGSPFHLTVTPTNGSWISTPYLTTGGLFTPSLSPIGNAYVQYVIGTSTCNASQTKIIQIESFVSAAIIGQVGVQCITNPPISLVPYAQSNAGTWSGQGLTGSSFNPGIAGSGNFVLTHNTASSPSGLCPDQATLAIQVFSLAPPVIVKTNTLCNNALPFQLQVSPVGGLFSGALPGVVSPGGQFNPALAAIGDNFINYTISVGPCKSNAQTKITIEKFVSAAFEKFPDAAYCRNQLPFNLNSLVQNPGGDWTPAPGLTPDGMFDPSKANIGDNNILHYTTYSSAANRLLCPDESTVQIRIKDLLPVKPTVRSNGNCLPVQIVLSTPETNQGQWIWNITDGTELSGLGATHTFTSSGTYTVLLTYTEDTEAKGCSSQVVLPPIVINPSPKADFSASPEEVMISEPLVTLTNLSTIYTENKYVWYIQSHDTSYEFNPKVKFALPGSYKITLTATNLYGCKNQTSKTIEVKNDFNVQIPNSFTPNFDGLNDVFIPVFTPYGLDTRTFEMEIFDRWGRQVYHSWDVTKGWDGAIGGEIAKEDSYVYRIRFKDLDGRVYSKTGHLTLLRN